MTSDRDLATNRKEAFLVKTKQTIAVVKDNGYSFVIAISHITEDSNSSKLAVLTIDYIDVRHTSLEGDGVKVCIGFDGSCHLKKIMDMKRESRW